MAEQTTTTKQAAAWNPPRLMILSLGKTDSGTKGGPDIASWETTCPVAPYPTYRMPISNEIGTQPPAC